MAADAIGFNYIPGSGLVAPLMAFEINSGGQIDGTTRAILVGHATAFGTIQPLVATAVASQDDADRLAGPGSMLREMYRIFSANAPEQPVWLEALPDVGTAEIRTLTIGALPGTGVGVIQIDGEQISISIGATDTPTTVAAALAAAINGYYNTLTDAMLPLTAQASSAVVTVTMRHKGAIMSDVDIYVPTSYVNNVFAQPGVVAIAVATAGAGVPVLAPALAALGDDPADFVVSPWSDPASLSSYTAWGSDVSGRWSWLRQVYGHVWTAATASFSGLVTQGLGGNDRHYSQVGRIPGMPRPSWLVVAGYCAQHAPWLSDCVTGNVSRNQSGKVIIGLAPPRDRSTWWNYQARNTLLSSGISTWRTDAVGNVVIDKCVTAYRIGASGQPDSVFRDIQAMYQTSGGLTYLRALLATEQGQKSIADSNPGNLAAITTTSDITGTFVHGYQTLCDRGVFENASTFAQILVVKRDTANPARTGVYAPLDRVNPLDVIAANATVYAQYQQAS